MANKSYRPKGHTFFVSDTHFGHTKIIDLSARPFKTASEMDSRIIENWNVFVQPQDEVFHLGDFAYGDRPYKESIFNRLNGRKHLVLGNHDEDNTASLGWESVSQIKEVTLDDTKLVLCHYPMREWPGFYGGALHLYGHVHSTLPGSRRTLDVGVDVIGWAPVELREIKRRMAMLPEVQFFEGQPWDPVTKTRIGAGPKMGSAGLKL